MFTRFVSRVVRFLEGEDGPTSVEYAVMLALIIVVCMASISLVGTNASSKLRNIASTIGTGS